MIICKRTPSGRWGTTKSEKHYVAVGTYSYGMHGLHSNWTAVSGENERDVRITLTRDEAIEMKRRIEKLLADYPEPTS